jgi:hypothetical protein
MVMEKTGGFETWWEPMISIYVTCGVWCDGGTVWLSKAAAAAAAAGVWIR